MFEMNIKMSFEGKTVTIWLWLSKGKKGVGSLEVGPKCPRTPARRVGPTRSHLFPISHNFILHFKFQKVSSHNTSLWKAFLFHQKIKKNTFLFLCFINWMCCKISKETIWQSNISIVDKFALEDKVNNSNCCKKN